MFLTPRDKQLSLQIVHTFISRQKKCVKCMLLKSLITHLLTHLLHGVESFLRS